MTAIYLDWNATAPLSAVARAAWLSAQDDAWGNPGSVHDQGQRARHAIDQAKATCARVLCCRTNELIVTSGGTEANALAIHAAAESASANGGNAALILASAIDHSSVLRNAELYGRLVKLPVDQQGRLHPQVVQEAMKDKPALVCFQFANNELGTRQDVSALVAAVRAVSPQTRVLLDCAQGAGKAIIDLRALDVDFSSIAGHKFGAPKGVGLLYVKNGVRLPPLIAGGRQQQDRRSGTEDAAGITALAAALSAAATHAEEEDIRQRLLLESAFARIVRDLPQAQWLAHAAERLPNTLSLAHPGIANETLVMRLDLAGIAVSTGAACMAARGEQSHVIAALGIAPDLARGVIRVSIGSTTTVADLDVFVATYVREVRALVR
ncbi:MAG: aminotransferase class V-fold PLP-dependent enzyme [Planctomycetes bacterium]|nr:aminotransferase class V-fold PLP-dependent enzyme [Planctomycetota bacterium]